MYGRIVEHGPARALFRRGTAAPTGCCGASPAVNPSHPAPGRAGAPADLVACPRVPVRPRCPAAQDRCREETPTLTDVGGGHQHACFFPVGTPEGEEALARNRSQDGTNRTTEVAV